MSWYRHTPKVKEPKYIPHTTSPMTEQKLKETKERVKPLDTKLPKKK